MLASGLNTRSTKKKCFSFDRELSIEQHFTEQEEEQFYELLQALYNKQPRARTKRCVPHRHHHVLLRLPFEHYPLTHELRAGLLNCTAGDASSLSNQRLQIPMG